MTSVSSENPKSERLSRAWSRVTSGELAIRENTVRRIARLLEKSIRLTSPDQEQIIATLHEAARSGSFSAVYHAGRVLANARHLHPVQQHGLCNIIKYVAPSDPDAAISIVAHVFERGVVQDERVRKALLELLSSCLPWATSPVIIKDAQEYLGSCNLRDDEKTSWDDIKATIRSSLSFSNMTPA